MERQVVFGTNGRAVEQDDINALGEAGGLADDRVLAEMLRLVEGSATPVKAILPFGKSTAAKVTGANNGALVSGGSADAKIRIMPFRAIVGSTTLAATSVLEHYRGIRSGIHVGASSLFTEKVIAVNGSGNPRWDLVYASVQPNVVTTDTRFLKSTSSGAISSNTYDIYKSTPVTITVLAGTPGASPTRPALPADAAGTYNIALAYVWVPSAHNGTTSTVARSQFYELASVASVAAPMGVPRCQPASSLHTSGQSVDSAQGHQQLLRPGAYLPSTMVGEEKRTILLQRGFAPVSHADGAVIDNSVDWRFRYFDWQIHARAGTASTAALASDRNATGTTPAGSSSLRTFGAHVAIGGGQSFVADETIVVADGNGMAMYVTDTECSQLGATTVIQIYVRNTDGALVFKTTGAGTYQARITITATAPYENFGAK
jgi:hypothetical protein